MRRLVIATTLLVSTAAFADPAPAPAPAPVRAVSATQMHTDDCARARAQNKTCVLDISGTEVDGHVVTPDGSAFSSREWLHAASLIHLRKDFITEIIKSAEDLN